MDTKSFLSLAYVRALIVLILIGVVCALAAYTKYTLDQSRYTNWGPTTINVQGEGEVLAKPDIGQFSFSVAAEAETAEAAQEISAESINAIIGYLTGAGVDEDDIKTTNYNLNPTYTYAERVCEFGSYCPPGDPEIDGYRVSQNVTVKVRDLEQSGTLISGVGENGATNISSLQFTIDDETALKAEARAKAIEDAKEKAEELADDLGVRIVRIVSYYEDQDYYPTPYAYDAEFSLARSESATVAKMPTGENSITSNVNITFEIR